MIRLNFNRAACRPAVLTLAACLLAGGLAAARPNILLVVTDDQSWPHAGAYGPAGLATPHFDALAREGVLFHQAFVSAPSCAPSRLAILTGRHFFQNQEGGVHGGFIPAKFPLYTDLLAAAGYHVGYTGKGCGPFHRQPVHGLDRDPLGRRYNAHRLAAPRAIHSFGDLDYARNFAAFLDDLDPGQPFCFTFNSWEPHRPYAAGSGRAAGIDPDRLAVPASLPDTPAVRADLADYALEVQTFDADLGRVLTLLAERGLAENTLVVVTSDNGMPFPDAKMHGYEYGAHVPFVVRWPARLAPGPATDALILVPEVAAFFLEAAGVPVPVAMMDSTLAGVLGLSGFTPHPANDAVVWGKERHNPARERNLGYPIRALRTADYLLVRNAAPERWPAGDPPQFKDLLWSPGEATMEHVLAARHEPAVAPFFERYTAKRPRLELFAVRTDPACRHNLAGDPAHAGTLAALEAELDARLVAAGDPRQSGDGECFDATPSGLAPPVDPATGAPVFADFPAPRTPTPGLRTFDHGDDAAEARRLAAPKPRPAAPARERLNILVILADDLAQQDLACYSGDPFHETPQLDRLAASALRFTDGYAANPVCSPTRYALQTGRWPTRVGLTNWLVGERDERFRSAPLPRFMAPAEITLAEILREAGYHTAFVGKWHLGETEEHWPEAQGYAVNRGGFHRGQPNAWFSPYRNPRLSDGPPGEYLTERLATDSIAQLRAAAESGRPFLLCHSFYQVHTPIRAPAELVAKYEAKAAALGRRETFGEERQYFVSVDGPRRVRLNRTHPVYAAMVEAMDTATGRILAALTELGLADNTLVIFTADNGGLSTSGPFPTTNAPLRAGKGWLYEGGIRVPYLVRWPGRTPAGGSSAAPVTTLDILPTALAAAGVAPPPGLVLDGRDLSPVLDGRPAALRDLFWHYPHYGNQGGFPGGAVRAGDWKLVENYEDGSVELFNLAADPGEQQDRAAAEPALAAALRSRLHAWYRSTGARFLRPRPDGPAPWSPYSIP